MRDPEALDTIACSRCSELVVEISASRSAYHLHDELRAHRRTGALEYLVWRVDDAGFDSFALARAVESGTTTPEHAAFVARLQEP